MQSKRAFAADVRLTANATNDAGLTAEQEAAAAVAESRAAMSESTSSGDEEAAVETAKPAVSYVEYVDARLPPKGRYEIVGLSQFEPWFIRLVTAAQVCLLVDADGRQRATVPLLERVLRLQERALPHPPAPRVYHGNQRS